jgi:hypothetical protein
VHDREAVNKGVKSRGIIFGYTINRNAIPNAHPTSLDHYLIEKHNPDNIYLKWMSKNPRSGCHPGQLLKFRNASYLESQLRCFSSLFEKPFHWWKTEPGYEALLHSMKIKPFVQQRKTDAVENTSYMGMVSILIFTI